MARLACKCNRSQNENLQVRVCCVNAPAKRRPAGHNTPDIGFEWDLRMSADADVAFVSALMSTQIGRFHPDLWRVCTCGLAKGGATADACGFAPREKITNLHLAAPMWAIVPRDPYDLWYAGFDNKSLQVEPAELVPTLSVVYNNHKLTGDEI